MPTEFGPLPQYLTLAQASAIASVSTRTLRRAIVKKFLRAHRLGRLVRIDVAELQRWIESNGNAPPAAPPDRAQQPSAKRPTAIRATDTSLDLHAVGRRPNSR